MPVTIDGTTGISGNGSGLTDLNASNLSTGTVPDARFPATLPAVSGANLTALNASNLGSGTVPDARFPATLPAASGANLTALNASNLGSGTVPDARFPATLPAASGANLTNLNASNLSTGTVATARLGTGTANSTTYLRGDQTWATVSGGVSSLNGQTGAITNTSVDAIGSYIAAVRAVNISSGQNANGTINETIAGSTLRYGYTLSDGNGELGDARYFNAGGLSYGGGGTALSGTWRLMVRDKRREVCGAGAWYPGLWVRIS